MDRLKGRTAIVTGAANGIGAAIATLFHEEGANVVIADVDGDGAQALADKLGAAALGRRFDVTDREDWPRLVAETVERFGRLDVLVNNAGVGYGALVVEEPYEQHRRLLDTNVTGTWNGMRAAIPQMTAQGAGSIVNISSIDGLVGVAHMTSYTASKFAVTGMTRTVAIEVARLGIRVNSIHPGFVASPPVARLIETDEPRAMDAIRRTPMGRAGQPREIARAALFFASDDSSFCAGSNLVVDGGHTAGPYRIGLEPAQEIGRKS